MKRGFTSKVKVTVFILMKIVIFNCIWRNAGIANVKTCREK